MIAILFSARIANLRVILLHDSQNFVTHSLRYSLSLGMRKPFKFDAE